MRATVWLVVCLLAFGQPAALAASDFWGRVTFNNVPVPGATVKATQEGDTAAATTNEDGVYRLTGLADGLWSLSIEMFGFETIRREIRLPAEAVGASGPVAGDDALTVRAFGELVRDIAPVPSRTFPRVEVAAAASASAPVPLRQGRPPAVDLALLLGPGGIGAADGLLINGSLNNGASTPFALPRAIGNNRARLPSLFTYTAGTQIGGSAWDASPYSIRSSTKKPEYADLQTHGMLHPAATSGR